VMDLRSALTTKHDTVNLLMGRFKKTAYSIMEGREGEVKISLDSYFSRGGEGGVEEKKLIIKPIKLPALEYSSIGLRRVKANLTLKDLTREGNKKNSKAPAITNCKERIERG